MQDLLYFFNHNLLLVLAWLGVFICLIALQIRIKFYGPEPLSTSSLVQLVNYEEALLYDLRPATEYSKGHISQAKNYQFSSINDSNLLVKKITSELKSKDKPVILVCKDGIKSNQEAFKLKSAGLKKVGYLKGGMQSWQAESLPTVND
ncbi:MAG: rhodanese-like domain-containing protein [Gammaproteobacteria bacterium]|nr:rhodanese-like domain-containing protein [Gammaproteobacteria bacterium]